MALKQAGRKKQATVREHRQALETALDGMDKLVAMHGECEFLRIEAVALFRRAWREKYPDGDEIVLRAAGEARAATLSDITAELSGASLFAKDKLVIVRQAEKILFSSSSKNDELSGADAAKAVGGREKAFLERIEKPPSSTWLVLDTAQLPRNRTLGKRIAETFLCVPCPQPYPGDIPPWLAQRAQCLGKTLDDEAADLLCRAHGVNLGELAGEIDKLALFAGEGKRIDADMVSEFLTGTIEFDIFGFTNAVEARDRKRAVHFARRIAVQGTRDQKGKREDGVRSAHRVLSMLAGTVQGLLRARLAGARNLSPGEFAAAEKLSPMRADKLIEASLRFSLRELRVMAREVAEQMRRAHDTGGDPLLSLELMAVRFTGRDLR